MKSHTLSFAHLRRLLLDLHFTESRKETYWRFEHPESDTVFLFRPYALDEHVTPSDLVATRMQLDWRGLLPASVFDHSLNKTPA
jgi:hypothetical protein